MKNCGEEASKKESKGEIKTYTGRYYHNLSLKNRG
jgi:hypothetical protein